MDLDTSSVPLINSDRHGLQRFDAKTLVLVSVGKLQTYLQAFALQPRPQEACANLAEKTQLMISLSHLVPSPWKFNEANLLDVNEEKAVAVHPSRQCFSTGRGLVCGRDGLRMNATGKDRRSWGRGNENRADSFKSYIWDQ
jgi:hypothetical protein